MTKTVGSYFIEVEIGKQNSHYVDVRVWDIQGWTLEEPSEPLFGDNLEFERGEPEYSGSCKWDGCMNFDLGNLHLCDPKDAVELGAMLTEVYAMSKAAMIEAGTDVDY